jgi:hypothetical protein
VSSYQRREEHVLQQALILTLALCAGLLEALLVVAAPRRWLPDLIWAVAGGFCLALAGTCAVLLAGFPRQAWGRRALCGAAIGMLAQGVASACAVLLSSTNAAAGPLWLAFSAPLLGVVGILLGSLLEGVVVRPPARCAGRGRETRA